MAAAYRGDTFRAMAARPILTFVLCSAALMTGGAHASPRTDVTAGRSVFTGATTPHASSITVNPAALGLSEVDQIFVAMTGLVDMYQIERRELDLDTGALRPGDTVESSELGVGGMLGAVLHPGTRYAVSFELRTPPPEVFPTEHEALRYHTLGGRQRDYLASIGSTIKISSALYFGASVSHDNTFLRMEYARDTAVERGEVDADCGGGTPCGLENPAAAEIDEVTVRSPAVATSNLKVTIGLLARLSRNLWLGVAYHTPPGFAIQTQLDGDLAVNRAPRDGGGVARGGATVYTQYPASVDGELRLRLPQLLDITLGGRWEDLSRFTAYDVRAHGPALAAAAVPEWTLRPRGMHDAFALWGGVEQIDFGQQFRLAARAGFETSYVDTSQTSAITIGPASLTLDAGVQVRLAPTWILELAYGVQYFPEVQVETSAYDPRFQLACIASGFDYDTRACRSVREGYAIPTAAGDYSRLSHAFRLGLRYDIP